MKCCFMNEPIISHDQSAFDFCYSGCFCNWVFVQSLYTRHVYDIEGPGVSLRI